ncbi:MAG: response regulator [Candidatus Angelobacter sp.]
MKAIQPATILAVDDTDAQLYFVSHVLSNAGFAVKKTMSGSETLKLAEDLPDLIILDVKLPDLNGFEICRRLKENPATANIPVVFLSSVHDPADGKRRAQYLGAYEFLSYPIQPDQLTVIVNAVLEQRKRHSS